MKESEKINKSLDLAREPRKLENMKVRMIPIVVGALPGGLGKKLKKLEIRDRIETIQIKDRVKYLEKSWMPEETFCYSNSSERLWETGEFVGVISFVWLVGLDFGFRYLTPFVFFSTPFNSLASS